jgi:filamentous hemagglutinin family protein
MLITKFSQMFKIDILVRSILTLGILSGLTISASADITPGGDGTIVNQSGNTFNITGGTPDGSNNLFHSFGAFNLTTTPTISQVANFQPTANVQNIFGRINGGLPSSIDGKLQVTGGDPKGINLYLMNPAGIVFGKGASLDINGAFTATTAKAIDFNGKWFNAVGANNYSELTGNPIGLAFTGSTPGSIFSVATLSNVQPGKSITLVGGTVISTGDIKTAGGNISIATVEGGKYVQIKSDGSLLRLDLPASANSIAKEATAFTPLKLAELLTSPGVDLAATGVKSEKGIVTLIGDAVKIDADIAAGDTISRQNRSISSGDIITRNLDTRNINKGGDIHIKSSQAILSGDIVTKTDSSTNNSINLGGNVVLDAQTELKTKEINSSSVVFASGSTSTGGNVTLSTQTKDIIVDSINTNGGFDEKSFDPGTRLTKAQSTGFLGGNVTIKSAGLFRVITTDGISSSLFGVINIKHGSKKPFASGVTGEPRQTGGPSVNIPGFTFPDGASGSRGAIVTSRGTNGSIGIIYKDQPIDGSTTAANNTLAISPVKKDRDNNSGDGTGTDVATNKSGDNSEEQDSTRQKPKCNNSSAIASAKIGTDPTRSGNIANSAAEEFCPPNTSNGILQILTDRE